MDTSALVKRYIAEHGSNWVIALTDPIQGHDLYTQVVTGVEAVSAFTRKARTGEASAADVQRALTNFRYDWQTQYLVIEVTDALIAAAMDLVVRFGLRAYDAVHLASALQLHQGRESAGLSPLIFVSADRDQLAAAATEGLAVEDPNSHA